MIKLRTLLKEEFTPQVLSTEFGGWDDMEFLKKTWNMPIEELYKILEKAKSDLKFLNNMSRTRSVIRVLYKKDAQWVRARVGYLEGIIKKKKVDSSFRPDMIKENVMKKSELKRLITEVVSQINEYELPNIELLQKNLSPCPRCGKEAKIDGANGGSEYAVGCYNGCKNWQFDGLADKAVEKWEQYVHETVGFNLDEGKKNNMKKSELKKLIKEVLSIVNESAEEWVSSCCSARPLGELDRNHLGRCSKCKEGTDFIDLNTWEDPLRRPIAGNVDASKLPVEMEESNDRLKNFSNVGTDEDGNLIGNCKLCHTNGVLIPFHDCKKMNEQNETNSGISEETLISNLKSRGLRHLEMNIQVGSEVLPGIVAYSLPGYEYKDQPITAEDLEVWACNDGVYSNVTNQISEQARNKFYEKIEQSAKEDDRN